MFHNQTYIARRTHLKKQFSSGIILLPGNRDESRNFKDNTYPFRQDSSFLFYFGLSHSGLAGIMDLDEDTDRIYGNDLSIDDIVWMGYQPTIRERAERAGVTETGSLDDLAGALKAARAKGRTIHFLPPYRPENRMLLSRWLDIPFEKVNSAASVELIRAVVAQREIKTDEELAEIGRAVDTSVDMHTAAMEMVRPGMKESAVAARMEEIALAAGGASSFLPIATVHGETLHNHYHGNRMEEGQLFLLDAGAETAMGYAGDLSSTIPVSPRFSDRQKEIYTISLEAHDAAIRALKPGVPFRDIYYEASRRIVGGLKELGLMKGDTDEALRQGAHAQFFPCGLGHQMGLDVHDMEDLGEVWVGYDGESKSTQFGLKSLRLAKPLKPGMVLTIEPGIYFIPALMDLWRKEGRHTDFICYDRLVEWRSFGGIRNEENFVITETGARLLGKPKPKTIADVEALRIGR